MIPTLMQPVYAPYVVRRQPHADSHNDILLDRLTQAKRALIQLKRDGFDVIAVSLATAMPLITIQTNSRCQQLIEAGRAAHYSWQHKDGGYERRGQFGLEGCTITWTERGH
ncbi:MAG: hypothetical protein Q8O37_16380 [Sulfuricellaceae bacterium]|nr:hypothetical protein [Sulfuricellaceae bacterium]